MTGLRTPKQGVLLQQWVDTANPGEGKAVGGVLPSESPEAYDCTTS